MAFKSKEEDEEDNLVEVVVELSATTSNSWATSCEISQILCTLCVNTVDNLTMP